MKVKRGRPRGRPRKVTRPSLRRRPPRARGARCVADRQGVEVDAQAGAFAVRPGRADPRPDGILAFALPDGVGDQCGFLVAHDFSPSYVKPHNGASMRVRQSGPSRASTGFERTRNARPSALLQRDRPLSFLGTPVDAFARRTALEPHKSRPVAATAKEDKLSDHTSPASPHERRMPRGAARSPRCTGG
jgi:hypothetical protein